MIEKFNKINRSASSLLNRNTTAFELPGAFTAHAIDRDRGNGSAQGSDDHLGRVGFN